jgi:hypothetical protein
MNKKPKKPKKPKQYFKFKLWHLNRIFRTLGFVLIITIDKKGTKETTLHFASKKEYDKWSLNLKISKKERINKWMQKD